MFSDELDDLRRRHGLSDETITEFRVLLLRAAPPPSQVSTLVELQEAVTLLPDADWGAEVPTSEVPVDPDTETTAKGGNPGGPTGRYQDLGLLGMGGMAEVRRVRDRALNRVMAMKIIHGRLMAHPSALARFIEEAQCSAQLQHPGIVPVHELGELADGRAYFTMAQIKGQTFSEVISEVHTASHGDRWEMSASGWTFRRLIDAFHRICEAVAYAHVRGVVHRDLKPENVMVGKHGEVLVVDWGLAKVLGHTSVAADLDDPDWVSTDRSKDDRHATQIGRVAGTPAYMSPEQARGENHKIDARSDVYSLGAMLYEVLGGARPYGQRDALAVVQLVMDGPPPDLDQSVQPERQGMISGLFSAPSMDSLVSPVIPTELLETCRKAMARDQNDRFDDARVLAAAVSDWLDGAKRREQALAVVNEVRELGPQAKALRKEAAVLRHTSESLLADIAGWESEARKAPGWALADRATDLDKQAEDLTLQIVQSLHGALTHAPDLPEAHIALAERYRVEHVRAERDRNAEDASRVESLLRTHASALPKKHAVRRSAMAYLAGTGALSLLTDPPGAQVLLHRYERQNRRLVPVFQRSLGVTPLRTVPVERGSYLCILRHPDYADVAYPVHIARQSHWDGYGPDDPAAHRVRMIRRADLAEDDRLVSAGWFLSGGDDGALNSLPQQRLWCSDVVFKRFPVTNRQFIAFLDDLVESGRESLALACVPREKPANQNTRGAMLYGRDAGGRFELCPDADGDVWQLDWPVVMVDWFAAAAYADWFAARTNQPWRLASELEREKAARGVDGRFFPWGDQIDPSWCCYRASHAGALEPASVDRFPVDESVYGIRGLAGNVRDWCGDVYDEEGPQVHHSRVVLPSRTGTDGPVFRSARGGAWGAGPRYARVAVRNRSTPTSGVSFLGFRLVRSV